MPSSPNYCAAFLLLEAMADKTAEASKLINPATWTSAGDLIALEALAARMDLHRFGPARALRSGAQLSRFRGRGMDYLESRGYQPGDDVRSMDWRITARTGSAYTKVYQEEREQPVLLCLDLNPGMFFGSRGMLKSVAAARVAALLAWAASGQGDKVGAALLLPDGRHIELPPRGGRVGVVRLVQQLVAHTDPRQDLTPAGDGTRAGLDAGLARLRRISRPGSLVVLISDFYAAGEDTATHLAALRRHNDLLALQIVDPLEMAPPPGARYGIAAGGWRGILDTRSARTRSAYQAFFNQHHERIARLMNSQAISLLRLSTAADITSLVQGHFGRRSGSATASSHRPVSSSA